MVDIEHLRRLYDRATPGPWPLAHEGMEIDYDDHHLITAMHAMLPLLLDEVEDLRRSQERVRTVLIQALKGSRSNLRPNKMIHAHYAELLREALGDDEEQP